MKHWPALLVCASLTLTACGDQSIKGESYVFGTRVEITLISKQTKPAQQLLDANLRQLDQWHHELHAWQAGPLQAANLAFNHGQSTSLSPAAQELLRLSQHYTPLTQGLFNPALGGLFALWGFHSDLSKPALPDPAQLQRWQQQPLPQPADIQKQGGLYRSHNPAVQLDFGGIAKGWALDQLALRFHQHGFRHALINIGGNVLALGQNGERLWQVGLRHPRRPEAMLSLWLKPGEAIGTSGDYQRFFMLSGQRYHHLLDPRTRHPGQSSQSATVIAPPGPHAGLISDLASKPLFLDGPQHASQHMKKLGIRAWLVVASNGAVYCSPEFQQRAHWLRQEPVTVIP
jgi:FAD:protein FMN transferase